MSRALFIVMLPALGCSSGGSSDPCAMPIVYTCTAADGSTCDEVYTASARDALEPLCNAQHGVGSSGPCDATLHCCLYADGAYGDGAQLSCVSSAVSPEATFRARCTSYGNTYCAR